MELNIFCTEIYYKTVIQDCSSKIRRKFYFNKFPSESQIFKLVMNLEAEGICEDCRVTSFSPSGPLITPEEYAYVINNLARHTHQFLQVNGEHLEHQRWDSSWHFWFVFETKWLQVLKRFYFTFQLIEFPFLGTYIHISFN